MKKLQFMAWPKLCSMLLLGAGALFVASCATDGYDNDEKWESSVNNTQMTSPAADAIEIFSKADISIAYMYSFMLDGKGILIFRTDNAEQARETIIQNGLKVIAEEQLTTLV